MPPWRTRQYMRSAIRHVLSRGGDCNPFKVTRPVVGVRQEGERTALDYPCTSTRDRSLFRLDRRPNQVQRSCMVVPAFHSPRSSKQVVSDGRWSAAYAPQRTIIVPDYSKAALQASPIARKFFESLDSKNRYAILYRLHNAKKPETRERRLLKFIQMLKAGETLHERPGKFVRRAVQR